VGYRGQVKVHGQVFRVLLVACRHDDGGLKISGLGRLPKFPAGEFGKHDFFGIHEISSNYFLLSMKLGTKRQ
jgi:hypothetical protein